MAETTHLVASLFKIHDIGKNFKIFFDVLPAPVNKTLGFVAQDGGRDTALSFLGFGLSILVMTGLVAGIEQPGLDQFGWQGRVLQGLIQPLALLIFFAIYYKIFKDVSASSRTFDEYVTLCGVQGGFTYILSSAFLIMVLLFPALVLIGGLLLFVLLMVYSIRLFKEFWGISYGKVILYSFISSLLSFLCMAVIVVILASVLLG